MQNWLKITLTAKIHEATRISEVFELIGALSITVTSANNAIYSDESTPKQPSWAIQKICALFPEQFSTDLVIDSVNNVTSEKINVAITTLQDRNWVLEGQKATKPLEFENNLWICADWHKVPSDNAKIIWINPGLAFGTGHHPTTALCLKKLIDLDLTDKVVLDWGCGSGVLAIASLVLGANRVLAVDIDDQALLSTSDHAKKNNVSDRLITARPEDIPKNFRCEILIANLLTSTIIKLKNAFEHHLSKNGRLLLSGILENQTKQVISALGNKYSVNIYSEKGWAMISAGRDQNFRNYG